MNKKIKRIIPFTTLQKINKKINGRPIVLFGVGRIAKKTMRFLTNQKITTVVDNASNLWGEIDNGIRVMSPEFLKSKKGSSGETVATSRTSPGGKIKKARFDRYGNLN